jgi:predicted neuraminidase
MRIGGWIVAIVLMAAAPLPPLLAGPIVTSEFIFETAPFASCHASTIVQTKTGLAAAWFGGTKEGAADVGIWVSLQRDGKWSPPVEVGKGDGVACWNPVLFQSKEGPLLLFYKVGATTHVWWGMLASSEDEGLTWSAAQRLPEGILGPTKDKPIQLADGTILAGSSTENDGWKVHVERSTDGGKTWTKGEPLNDGGKPGLIQPTLLDHGNGAQGGLEMLCRSRNGFIYQSWSSDSGKSWATPTATELANPNSGIDAVKLADGRSLLVYNDSPTARRPLNVAVSGDGRVWKMVLVVEDLDGQLAYPAVIQTGDGMVHITYTWKRLKIRHVVIDPRGLE